MLFPTLTYRETEITNELMLKCKLLHGPKHLIWIGMLDITFK